MSVQIPTIFIPYFRESFSFFHKRFDEINISNSAEKHPSVNFMIELRKYLIELAEHKTNLGTILLKVSGHEVMQICSTGGTD